MEALPTFTSIPDDQNELPPSIGDTPEYILGKPNNPMASSSTTAKDEDSRNVRTMYSYTPFTNTHGVKAKGHNTPSSPLKNNDGDGFDLSKVGNMNPGDLIQVMAPLDANGNSTGFDGNPNGNSTGFGANPEIHFPVTNGETNTTLMHNPSSKLNGEDEEQEQTTLVEKEEQAHEWIEEEEDEWENEEVEGAMTTKAGESEMSNMIVKLGDSNGTAPPTGLDSSETELEDFIDESMKQFEGPTERQDSNTVVNSTAVLGEGGATTPVGDSSTSVPTDLVSMEAEMEDFIEDSMSNWNNSTDADGDTEIDGSEKAGGGSVGKGGKRGSANGTKVKKKHTAGGKNVGKGGKGGAVNGANVNKDGMESLLDDDATKALFEDPTGTRAPTAKITWNDTAPVFKPELPASTGTTCSLSDYQACMTNPYVLGGAASIVLILLLCICRKCCCRKSQTDEKGQYRQVAAQYGDMKYDNTFSDDYSADGSSGDIELSLSEVNG